MTSFSHLNNHFIKTVTTQYFTFLLTGTIPLLKGYSVHAQQPPFFESKFHHVLLLNTIERKFYLCAESEDMKKRWLDTLSQVIKTRDESCIAKDGDAITEPVRLIFDFCLVEKTSLKYVNINICAF